MSILDSNEHADIISWLPHGRGFIIRDKRRLADEVLPKYFKESKYTSFTRRLNRWNFTIQTHGHKEASYFHPMFIRGDPQRSLEMHPTPQSSNKARESRYIDDAKNPAKDKGAAAGAASNPPMGMSLSVSVSGYPNSAQLMAGTNAHAPNASMPALPQASQMAGGNPGASAQLPQGQAMQMQPPFYGQVGQVGQVGMNPMYGSQAHQRSNVTRDMMFMNAQAQQRPGARDFPHSHSHPQSHPHSHSHSHPHSQNGMVMLHPQLGSAAVMHPHQMPYGEFPQYIPTTAASHAHFAQMQQQLRYPFPQGAMAPGAYPHAAPPPEKDKDKEKDKEQPQSKDKGSASAKGDGDGDGDGDKKEAASEEKDTKTEEKDTKTEATATATSEEASKTINEQGEDSKAEKEAEKEKKAPAPADDSKKSDETLKEESKEDAESSQGKQELTKEKDDKKHPAPESSESEPSSKKSKPTVKGDGDSDGGGDGDGDDVLC